MKGISNQMDKNVVKKAKETFRRMRLVIKIISTRLGGRSMRRYLPNNNEALVQYLLVT